MSRALERRLHAKRFADPADAAVVALLVATGRVRDRLDRVFARFGVTAGQYNVLRILKGGPGEGYPRCDIAERMIERAPDITRLVDRLERAGLARRHRSGEDRRLSLTRITPRGAALVEKISPEVERVNQEVGALLGPDGCRRLVDICEPLFEAE